MKCLIAGVVSLLSLPTALPAQAPSGGRFGGGEFIIACPGLSRDESTDHASHTQRSSSPTRLLQRNTPYQYWRLNPPRFGTNQETKATDQETREPVPKENQEEPTSYFGNDKLEEQPAVPLRTVVSMALQFEALPSCIAMTGHRTPRQRNPPDQTGIDRHAPRRQISPAPLVLTPIERAAAFRPAAYADLRCLP
jgi:hypothetical protein